MKSIALKIGGDTTMIPDLYETVYNQVHPLLHSKLSIKTNREIHQRLYWYLRVIYHKQLYEELLTDRDI